MGKEPTYLGEPITREITVGRVDGSMQAALPWDSTVAHMCCVPVGKH